PGRRLRCRLSGRRTVARAHEHEGSRPPESIREVSYAELPFPATRGELTGRGQVFRFLFWRARGGGKLPFCLNSQAILSRLRRKPRTEKLTRHSVRSR